jgi:hypothetical protein
MGRCSGLACQVVETEFWGAMDAPNLMVESSVSDLADLVAALSLHVGEVARNAFHLRRPAWMMDNVRRGAELVGGQGGAAPSFAFATLYRLRHWTDGRLHEVLDCGQVLSSQDTREKALTPITRQQNAAMLIGGDPDKVPKRALTMGVGTILDSRELLLLATGGAKASILAKAVEGPITAMISASAMQLHPNCKVIVDEEAGRELKERDYYNWIFENEPEWQEFRA